MTIYDWLSDMGIKFNNKKLYETALTHTSYLNEHKIIEHDNERLEFLGDSVLQIWTAEHLFKMEPILKEGQMTTMRAQLVCEKALAEYCRKLDLPKFLRLGAGEEKTGGRDRESVIADMFEAILGAIYIDCGMEAVNKVLSYVITPIIQHPELTGMIDYKTKLQEFVQSETRETVSYQLVESKGTSNNPTFIVNAVLDGIVLGNGEGTSKKRAEQNAAKDALSKMAK